MTGAQLQVESRWRQTRSQIWKGVRRGDETNWAAKVLKYVAASGEISCSPDVSKAYTVPSRRLFRQIRDVLNSGAYINKTTGEKNWQQNRFCKSSRDCQLFGVEMLVSFWRGYRYSINSLEWRVSWTPEDSWRDHRASLILFSLLWA